MTNILKDKKYRTAIDFIALNDEPDIMNIDTIQEMISVVLTAVIFNVSTLRVAQSVWDYRKNYFTKG